MAESDLVRRWMQRLRELGAFAERSAAFDIVTGKGNMRIGFPDVIAVYKGVPIFIEAKRDKKEWEKWMNDKSEQAPGQKLCIEELRNAGAVAFCAYDWSSIQAALDVIDEYDYQAGALVNNAVDMEQMNG